MASVIAQRHLLRQPTVPRQELLPWRGRIRGPGVVGVPGRCRRSRPPHLLHAEDGVLPVCLDGQDPPSARHLEDIVGVVRRRHEFCQCRAPKDTVVGQGDIGHVEDDVLRAEVGRGPERNRELDLPQGLSDPGVNSLEGSRGAKAPGGNLELLEHPGGEEVEAGTPVDEHLGDLGVVDRRGNHQRQDANPRRAIWVISGVEGDWDRRPPERSLGLLAGLNGVHLPGEALELPVRGE